MKTMKELLKDKRISYSEKDTWYKENSVVNSINVTVDLNVLDNVTDVFDKLTKYREKIGLLS